MSGTVEKQRPDDRSESEEEEDEEEEDEEEEEVASQEEESTAPLFHHHPYHSYSFAATSWELRKNLTETFNKHVEAKKEGERSESRPTSIQAAQTVFPISSSSNNIITDDSKKHSSNNALGKPPRKPHSQPANKQETTKTMVDNKKHNVSVYLRVRPTQEGLVNTIEILPGNPPSKVRTYAPERSNAAKINRATGNNSTLQLEPPTVAREFEFEKVFGPDQKQENIYSDIVAPMVERMFPKFDTNANTNQEPESGLLFAYGATNAGKTYSILGKLSSSDKREPITKQEKHWGIVPRAFQDILGNIERYQELDSSQDMELYLSIYEIYNENIYDLLADATSSSHPIFMREPLKLRESRKQTFIRGLARKKVTSVSEGLKYARQANSKRHTSSNK